MYYGFYLQLKILFSLLRQGNRWWFQWTLLLRYFSPLCNRFLLNNLLGMNKKFIRSKNNIKIIAAITFVIFASRSFALCIPNTAPNWALNPPKVAVRSPLPGCNSTATIISIAPIITIIVNTENIFSPFL